MTPEEIEIRAQAVKAARDNALSAGPSFSEVVTPLNYPESRGGGVFEYVYTFTNTNHKCECLLPPEAKERTDELLGV